MTDTTRAVARVDELLTAARADGRRRLLGIAGAPAAGKSTLAEALRAHAGPTAAVVGMDGWHLADTVLRELGRRERKGAPDTFDAAGYVAFLQRVRADDAATVWAPRFDRDLEEAIAGSLAVTPEHRLVITEGNYLLLDEPPWDRIRLLLDEVWFVAPDEQRRRGWLVARHRRHGDDPGRAAQRADGPDAANARRVAATAGRADLLL